MLFCATKAGQCSLLFCSLKWYKTCVDEPCQQVSQASACQESSAGQKKCLGVCQPCLLPRAGPSKKSCHECARSPSSDVFLKVLCTCSLSSCRACPNSCLWVHMCMYEAVVKFVFSNVLWRVLIFQLLWSEFLLTHRYSFEIDKLGVVLGYFLLSVAWLCGPHADFHRTQTHTYMRNQHISISFPL